MTVVAAETAVSAAETTVSAAETTVSAADTTVSAAETTVFRPLKQPFSYPRTRKRNAKLHWIVHLLLRLPFSSPSFEKWEHSSR